MVVITLVVYLAWNPLHGIIGLTLLHLGLMLIVAVMLRVLSIPFKGRMSFKQALSLLAWGATHFLLIIPIGLINYSLLGYGSYRIFALILLSMFSFWYLLRVVTMIRISYKVGIAGSWIIVILVFIVLATVKILFYESGYSILENLDHLTSVLVPWMGV